MAITHFNLVADQLVDCAVRGSNDQQRIFLPGDLPENNLSNQPAWFVAVIEELPKKEDNQSSNVSFLVILSHAYSISVQPVTCVS